MVNYQALPDAETFYHPSGIRMGVQEMTRFGMKEQDFDTLARFMADIILKKKNVAKEVAEFRGRYTTMKYCLTPEQTAKIAPKLLATVFPDEKLQSEFVKILGNS
jgi:hypothetical protein